MQSEYIVLYSAAFCGTDTGNAAEEKTIFAAVATYVWRSLGVPVRVAKTASVAGLYLVDLPAFRLDDRLFVKILSKCKAFIYVVDEDFETLESVERLHAAVKGEVYGVILNKVFRKPGGVFVRAYKSCCGEVKCDVYICAKAPHQLHHWRRHDFLLPQHSHKQLNRPRTSPTTRTACLRYYEKKLLRPTAHHCRGRGWPSLHGRDVGV